MFTNRKFQIAFACVVAAVALLTMSMIPARHPAVSANAYDAIEQVRAARYAAAAAQQAYLDQRQGEWTAGHAYDAQQAYLSYRQGEWTAGTGPAFAYLQYRRGEWSGK